MKDESIKIEWEPTGGNGKVNITVRRAGELLHSDKLDVLTAPARTRFAKDFGQKYPGIEREEIERQLLTIADETQKVQQAQQKQVAGSPADAGELDVSRIVRPERFILPGVSGLSVAVPVLREGKPAGRWMLYLQWPDGRREAMELPESITLADGSRVWIHPQPGDPGVQKVIWTEKARKAWLADAESPDPAEVFQRLCKCIEHFVDFPEKHAVGTTATLALWVLLTYMYPAWPAVPYLYLGGPKESGKSRVLEVLARLVFRPLVSSNMTAAALFRTLHGRGGTLLYDEAERLKEGTPDVGEINSMLLAGYKKGGRATRLEPVDDTFKTVEFDVYGPKALACIKGLPEALLSRCITVTMFRAGRNSPKPRRHIDGPGDRWQTLRDDLHALMLGRGGELLAFVGRADLCPAMSGRQFELWQPLLALAAWIGGGLVDVVKTHATGVIEAGRDEGNPDCDEVLLRSLAALVAGGEAPTAKEVLEKAKGEERQAFDHWSYKGVGTVLRRYQVVTRKVHGRLIYRDVTVADLQRIQATYNMELGLPEVDPSESRGDTPENVPQVPQVPPGSVETGDSGASLGVHGAHGARGVHSQEGSV